MTIFIRVAPLLFAAVTASTVSAVPAQAQPGAGCQFGAGSTCGSAPEDDYSDFIYYPPIRRGFGYGGGFYGGLYGDDSPPGISAGPGM